jgi:hypothetical protein
MRILKRQLSNLVYRQMIRDQRRQRHETSEQRDAA